MNEQEREIIEQSIEKTRQQMADFSYQVDAGEIDENQWTEEIIALMVAEYLRQYMVGNGSIELSSEQISEIQEAASFQSQFIKATGAILATLSIQEITRRAAMYANSARWMYEQAKAGRYGIGLPAYPGDGTSICKSNCRCAWEIVDGDGGVILAYWRLGAADHCRTCTDRAQMWNPYIIGV